MKRTKKNKFIHGFLLLALFIGGPLLIKYHRDLQLEKALSNGDEGTRISASLDLALRYRGYMPGFLLKDVAYHTYADKSWTVRVGCSLVLLKHIERWRSFDQELMEGFIVGDDHATSITTDLIVKIGPKAMLELERRIKEGSRSERELQKVRQMLDRLAIGTPAHAPQVHTPSASASSH